MPSWPLPARGKPLPSGAEYAKAEDADRGAQARADVLAEVLETRTTALATVTSVNATPIIVDHLRPALAETLEEAKLAVGALEPFDLAGPERFVNAADDVRAAYGVLTDLAYRYAALTGRTGLLAGGAAPGVRHGW